MNLQKSYKVSIYLWLVATMVSGCALQPVTNLKTRYYGNGFSALPPQGKDWYIVNNDSFLLEFGKLPSDKLEKYHTFITEIMAMKPEGQECPFSIGISKSCRRYLYQNFER